MLEHGAKGSSDSIRLADGGRLKRFVQFSNSSSQFKISAESMSDIRKCRIQKVSVLRK